MSSILSGGGRAYNTLNLDIIKSPSTSWISNSSSPSSTLYESSNSPLTISTRKPRTPRKRPNQIYNEAAAILSTAHPKIFPKNKFTKKSYDSCNKNPIFFEPTSELLIPFRVIDNSGFLLHDPPILERPSFPIEPKGLNLFEKPCLSPGEITSSNGNFSEICDGYEEDFDAESILDEEIEEGIDSIMGNLSSVENESNDNSSSNLRINSCTYGYPAGLGFDFGYGMRSEMRAIRDVDEGDWWRFPSVNVLEITPKIERMSVEKKKKKKKVEIKNSEKIENLASKSADEESIPQKNVGLLLKLNYDSVLNEWSDKDSPFSGDAPGGESAGNDVQARLAQIDLFSENGMRGASVLRYKEKRRTRLFSKKIRYQVRKVNADRRPRMKGRFVRSPHSTDNEQGS